MTQVLSPPAPVAAVLAVPDEAAARGAAIADEAQWSLQRYGARGSMLPSGLETREQLEREQRARPACTRCFDVPRSQC